MSKVGYLMDNTTIGATSLTDRNLIIMDEVDGMAGNEDKGGISALIEISKKQKFRLYVYAMIFKIKSLDPCSITVTN